MQTLELRGLLIKSPLGKPVKPYLLDGDTLVKLCKEHHLWRARQALGVDVAIWERVKNHVQRVQFQLWDGRVYEISRDDFEERAFLHGDDVEFARTLFVQFADLRLVREAPPAREQLALAF